MNWQFFTLTKMKQSKKIGFPKLDWHELAIFYSNKNKTFKKNGDSEKPYNLR